MNETSLRRWSKTKKTRQKHLFQESGFDYDPRIEQVATSVWLDGYFQSWRYFAADEESVRQILHSRGAVSPIVADFLTGMNGSTWIGVHVRRSDYLKVGNMALPGTSYYERAVEKIANRLTSPAIVVFTDDPVAARAVVPFADSYIGPAEMQTPGDVLTSLSYCSGFVGANSSFSWWAGFANREANTPRVFPGQWFAESPEVPRDLLIHSWTTIPIEQ
ncbi:alpha-1,2-fucosyltransferase [Pontimonas sp.]|nr:alpha-1,2-fucosyltransferase [Pontimonas sp.]